METTMIHHGNVSQWLANAESMFDALAGAGYRPIRLAGKTTPCGGWPEAPHGVGQFLQATAVRPWTDKRGVRHTPPPLTGEQVNYHHKGFPLVTVGVCLMPGVGFIDIDVNDASWSEWIATNIVMPVIGRGPVVRRNSTGKATLGFFVRVPPEEAFFNKTTRPFIGADKVKHAVEIFGGETRVGTGVPKKYIGCYGPNTIDDWNGQSWGVPHQYEFQGTWLQQVSPADLPLVTAAQCDWIISSAISAFGSVGLTPAIKSHPPTRDGKPRKHLFEITKEWRFLRPGGNLIGYDEMLAETLHAPNGKVKCDSPDFGGDMGKSGKRLMATAVRGPGGEWGLSVFWNMDPTPRRPVWWCPERRSAEALRALCNHRPQWGVDTAPAA